MNVKIDKKSLLALLGLVTLIILTRSHSPLTSIHLPDFTIPALFITGVYFRQWLFPVTICVVAVLSDNYAIVYKGVSASCITPAYTLMPLAFLAVHWSAKYIHTLAIKNSAQLVNVVVFVVIISAFEWLFTSSTYYAFTGKSWSNFPAYAMHWAPQALKYIFAWMATVVAVFSIVHHVSLLDSYKIRKN